MLNHFAHIKWGGWAKNVLQYLHMNAMMGQNCLAKSKVLKVPQVKKFTWPLQQWHPVWKGSCSTLLFSVLRPHTCIRNMQHTHCFCHPCICMHTQTLTFSKIVVLQLHCLPPFQSIGIHGYEECSRHTGTYKKSIKGQNLKTPPWNSVHRFPFIATKCQHRPLSYIKVNNFFQDSNLPCYEVNKWITHTQPP